MCTCMCAICTGGMFPGTFLKISDIGFENSWEDYSGAYGPSMVTKLGCAITITGMVKNGVAISIIFTLPLGYRPSYKLIFTCMTNGGVIARVNVYANGAVQLHIGDSAWVALNGITLFANGCGGVSFPT